MSTVLIQFVGQTAQFIITFTWCTRKGIYFLGLSRQVDLPIVTYLVVLSCKFFDVCCEIFSASRYIFQPAFNGRCNAAASACRRKRAVSSTMFSRPSTMIHKTSLNHAREQLHLVLPFGSLEVRLALHSTHSCFFGTGSRSNRWKKTYELDFSAGTAAVLLELFMICHYIIPYRKLDHHSGWIILFHQPPNSWKNKLSHIWEGDSPYKKSPRSLHSLKLT